MKHRIFTSLISSTAALSLAACRDATAPDATHIDAPASSAARLAVSVDSSVVWSAAALDDAATRLAAVLDDERTRREVSSALHALSSRLVAGASNEELAMLHERAQRVVHRLGNQSASPDLDAISLALNHARRELESRPQEEKR